MNYYEHHIGDYEQATAHLTACEDGIYGRLIRRYMSMEKALPADIPALQRLVRAYTKEEKKAVEMMLAEFFSLEDDGFHQHRCDAEIQRFHDKQRKASASANARWDKEKRTCLDDANAMRTHSERNANGMHRAPVPSTQTPDTNTPSLRSGVKRASAPPCPDEVTAQIWDDWLALRKAKKAPVTATVVASAKREAEKAGMTLDAFLFVWCARGSQGLQADWLKPHEIPQRSYGPPAQSSAVPTADETRRQLDAERERPAADPEKRRAALALATQSVKRMA